MPLNSPSGPPVTDEQSFSTNVFLVLPKISPHIEAASPTAKVNLEQNDNFAKLYAHKEDDLKEQLQKKQVIIKKQRHKIKQLSQKVRRLENRNKALKDVVDILKSVNRSSKKII